MKKGVSHVDWAISMSLFLVFVMLTIIFLKPGTEPIYNENTLLKIIENELKEDAYYTVEKQLLNIESNSTCFSSDKCYVRIKQASAKGLSSERIKDETLRRYVAIMNKSQTEYKDIIFDVNNEYCCSVTPTPCAQYPSSSNKYYHKSCYNQGNLFVLDFLLNSNSGVLKEDNYTFYILYSDNFTYNQESSVDIGLKDEPAPNDYWAKDWVLDGYNFSSKFGVSETYKGFSEEKLYSISNESVGYNYAALKDKWNIPEDKHFRIRINNLTTYDYYTTTLEDYYKNGVDFFTGFPEAEQIPTGVSVFVKEWNDWALTPEGNLIPVSARIELW